jgi:hypothetical protein
LILLFLSSLFFPFLHTNTDNTSRHHLHLLRLKTKLTNSRLPHKISVVKLFMPPRRVTRSTVCDNTGQALSTSNSNTTIPPPQSSESTRTLRKRKSRNSPAPSSPPSATTSPPTSTAEPPKKRTKKSQNKNKESPSKKRSRDKTSETEQG